MSIRRYMSIFAFSAVLFVSVVSVGILSGCGGHGYTGVYVRTGPPPALREPVPPSPGPGFVWIAGYHNWDGNAYVWVPGRWERHGGRWVPGHWRHNSRGWYWVEGHWR